jgi:GT2 family glycosyltransferase
MKKNVFISIVSHEQEYMIIENFINFPKSFDLFDIKLSFIDNTGSPILKSFCDENNHFYYHDGETRGFGSNHNKMFALLNPMDDDIFIVCNPDIVIQKDQLDSLLKSFVKKSCDIFSVKIYFDKSKDYMDNPDKYIPRFLNFAYSLATDKRLHYGENYDVVRPQWISGAFMVFYPKAYKVLGGFDEDYFMYCEDIDICLRANKIGLDIVHDHNCYIEHDTQMDSRSLFSPSMIWHMKSAVKFLVKNRLFKPITIARKQ